MFSITYYSRPEHIEHSCLLRYTFATTASSRFPRLLFRPSFEPRGRNISLFDPSKPSRSILPRIAPDLVLNSLLYFRSLLYSTQSYVHLNILVFATFVFITEVTIINDWIITAPFFFSFWRFKFIEFFGNLFGSLWSNWTRCFRQEPPPVPFHGGNTSPPPHHWITSSNGLPNRSTVLHNSQTRYERFFELTSLGRQSRLVANETGTRH